MHEATTILRIGRTLGYALGSGDDDSAEPVAESNVDTAETDSDPVDEPSVDAEPATGASTGTLTMDDGTVYSLEMSTCETSENGAECFLIEDGFDLLGRTSDGEFLVQLIRAGFDEENVIDTASLEGEFDEDGKNAGLLYSDANDTMEVSVDGGDVSGTVTMRAIVNLRPHGDEMAATFEINC